MRRAAPLAALALIGAGCGSHASTQPQLPAGGPPGVVRIALAHLLWPLDPARARTRDEIAVARALFATPLRTDPRTGEVRPGLCSTWKRVGRGWSFQCRHAEAIASELKRSGLSSNAAAHGRTLSVRSPNAPYLLTEARAAPQAVPGPFRLLRASPTRIVAERGGLRLDFRQVDPTTAARLFRHGKLDEAPVPLGDLQAVLRDPLLRADVRIRRLLAVDLVVTQPHGTLARFPKVRRAFGETADRADYQALVPELEAPPAENLVEPPAAKVARAAALAFGRAKSRVSKLPQVAVRFARPADPDLAFGAGLLVAAWRDIGLGPYFAAKGKPNARFERLLAPYPRLGALRAAARGETVIPISWVVDARLVSPRLRGWREDDLGGVDYGRVTLQGSSQSR
ncbi:MAG: hypothetical protein ACXVRD_06315 [Gaiellaceae bacterium]